jgi:hypothetical protein
MFFFLTSMDWWWLGICCAKSAKSAHICNDAIFFVSLGGKFGMEGTENKLNMITLLLKLKTLQLVSNYDPIQYLKGWTEKVMSNLILWDYLQFNKRWVWDFVGLHLGKECTFTFTTLILELAWTLWWEIGDLESCLYKIFNNLKLA